MTSLSSDASIGRTAELDLVVSMLDGLDKGAAAAFIVTGDSGLGKSHFLRLAARRLAAHGAVVLAGACLDAEDTPLGPLRQALRRLPGPPGDPSGVAVHDLRALLDGQGIADAGGLLDRISIGLARIANGRPLVLIVDDLQLIDRTTARLLRYLLAGLGGLRLLLVGAARLEPHGGERPFGGGRETERGLPRVREMLADLRRLPFVQMRTLQPLTKEATERLATTTAARRLTPAEATLLWERSGGNPFLVEALARALREGGPDLPETVREIIRDRIESLPTDALTVTLAVAAGIEPVDHGLLAEVVPFDQGRLVEALRQAMRRRVLDVCPEGYVFHLGLYREELETWHLPVERVLLHRAYARALTAPDVEPQYARLAHHWRHAGEPDLAMLAAMQAATDAEHRFGYREALPYWTLALDVVNESPDLSDVDRVALARSVAEAALRGGASRRCVELLDAITFDGPPPAWWQLTRAQALAALSRLDEAEEAYRMALEAPDASRSEQATAAARGAEMLLHMGHHAPAGLRARQALALAHGLPEMISAEVLAGTTLGFSQAFLDDAAAGRAAIEEALATAERAGGPEDVAIAYRHLAKLLTEPLNELEEGIEVACQGARRAAGQGLGRTHGASLLALAANGLFRLGRWREAEALVDEAMTYSPSGTEVVDLLLARCKLHLGLGDLNAGERDLDALETLTFGGDSHQLALRTLRAGLAMWRGRYAEARAAVRLGLDECADQADNVVALATLVWHGLRAEAEARTEGTHPVDGESVARLRGLTAELERAGRERTDPVREVVEAYARLCQAELGRIDNRPDPASWDSAAGLWEALRHPYPAAYSRLRQADAYFFKRVDSAQGARCLRVAFQRAVELEASPLTSEAQQLADRHRVTLVGPQRVRLSRARAAANRGRPAVLAPLTERELQVLALVARWLTNKQIAKELFIADRTVSAHVRSILAKLGVPRRALAAEIYLTAQQKLPEHQQ